jgi:hypothetical protein
MELRSVPPALSLGLGALLALTLLLCTQAPVRAHSNALPSQEIRAGPGTAEGSSDSAPALSGERAIVTDTNPITVYTAELSIDQPAIAITPAVVVTPAGNVTSTVAVTPTVVAEPNEAPSPPVLIAPPDGTVGVSYSPTLTVSVSDGDGDDLTVTFYGRWLYTTTAPNFSIVALPDTQYYSCGDLCLSDPAIFVTQTQWIVSNRVDRNIAFVTHLGDVVEFGDLFEEHWQNADAAMSLLETPLLPQWPDGTPYGIAVGNHDQYFGTTWFNSYFGVARFQGREYYGGHYGSTNNNHFDLFSVGNLEFVVVHLEYDASADPAVLAWADQLLKTYAGRRAIVSSHFLIWPGDPGDFGEQGQAIYDELKDNPNLFLMLCGHHTEEGRRVDLFQGHTVHTLLSDYQNRANGGDGWLRLVEFWPPDNEIQVHTYSPVLDEWETDADSEFTVPYVMDRSVYQVIAVNEGIPSGLSTAAHWPDLFPATNYEWYVAVSDGISTTVGPLWTFTTADEPIAGLSAINDSPTRLGEATTLTATVTSGSNVTYTWNFGDGAFGFGDVITHTFPEARVYAAVVTASNSAVTLTATTMVTIQEMVYSYVYLPLLTRE